MKKTLSIVFATLAAGVFFACNQPSTEKAAAKADSVMSTVTQPAEDTTALQPIAGKMGDPVCGMPYDTTYHEFSVYKNDTVHFCSPTCKRVFDKNPEKYAAKLGL
ncbi:YHS domain-containing protein [Chitinophaga sp.]|uniref:YHS domain-containing protein n=1 Tax=Chitinophaga sp. TaxID=1869181 RepID=UPI0031D17AA2